VKPASLAKQSAVIPDKLLADLRRHLVLRQVSSGIALLDAHAHLLASLGSAQPNAAAMVCSVAQWVDIGYREPELIEQLLARFPESQRGDLPVSAYLMLRAAQGLLFLLRDQPDDALRHFDLVLAMENELPEGELVAIVHFWNARCHRKKGEYDQALKQAESGRSAAEGLGHERMAAVMRVLESWLMFQKGHHREATRVLSQAEEVLRETDDHITLGNIYSAHGRMIRRQGRYSEALKFFTQAIEHFQTRSSRHRNLARSLVNIAYVQRLIAAQISRQIDAETERRKKSGKGSVPSGPRPGHWEQYEKIRAEAFANLDQAEEIYRYHRLHHGIGSACENRGLLYMDSGDLDAAAAQAERAYELGREENDSILMARARMLQCTIANAGLEEQIEGNAQWELAETARNYSRDAVESARRTQNQRLLARAWVWRGLTACNPAIDDQEDAKHCYDRAASVMKSPDHDDLWELLQLLKHKTIPQGSIDPLLRSWSQGITGEKTFQQMTEQFAEIVIPRVWEREGKKVSRVAARLKVSPKKVRRILARAGKLKNEKSD
jgi:tetratricopeptide (TPR) repeat protein